MIYLDSSAIVKLARQEAETDALRAWLAANPKPLAASALARTEAARALVRSEPAALPVLRAVLALLHQKPITDAVLDAAAQLPGMTLRSLDAIHLATAEELAPALTWFVVYDKRLAQAARARGLPVAAPA
ncbi:type II toxin-antitoxin system VapC family toxin [Candidatus Frankia alpina]|uniref:Ribonuclease VapC n=1 Tax=Candidatus Frankia alpina TaxID=2699483 RepID=A0A4S5ETI5_9ACTN|nr:type II toxin-antitoxin system VapC family toxin [Candidatus Frankia alpina]THJ75766.1 type II toxin-antitoxin system VapC family toxin [Candidatus Frankia alpina]